jgi:hypothetical protein
MVSTRNAGKSVIVEIPYKKGLTIWCRVPGKS